MNEGGLVFAAYRQIIFYISWIKADKIGCKVREQEL
jgi:hypothetical protein